MPAEFADLSPEKQQVAVIFRGVWMCGFGVVLCLICADPCCACFDEIGKRLGVSNFWVAFFLAPLASNIGELIATYNYVTKQTPNGVNIGVGTCVAGVIFNNSLMLGSSLLVNSKNARPWNFCAQVFGLVLAEWLCCIMCLKGMIMDGGVGYTVDGYVIFGLTMGSALLIKGLGVMDFTGVPAKFDEKDY